MSNMRQVGEQADGRRDQHSFESRKVSRLCGVFVSASRKMKRGRGRWRLHHRKQIYECHGLFLTPKVEPRKSAAKACALEGSASWQRTRGGVWMHRGIESIDFASCQRVGRSEATNFEFAPQPSSGALHQCSLPHKPPPPFSLTALAPYLICTVQLTLSTKDTYVQDPQVRTSSGRADHRRTNTLVTHPSSLSCKRHSDERL